MEHKGSSQHQHQSMEMRGMPREMMSGDQEHKMSMEDRMHMEHMHHMHTLWIYWMMIMLGVWLILSPLTFSYGKTTVDPSGGRILWLSLGERIAAMKWSDIISGALLIFFGWRSLTPMRPVSVWICCFIGIWLNVAPLLFWAPTAAAYINDTLIGVLVISLTILIPDMPGMMMYMKMGSDMPEGWSYNPSSWPQRGIMIALGFAGWMVSRYLGAFQLGYIDNAWDPFFGDSTRQVLNSHMSQSLFISDGAFGALAYTLEFLMGWMGGTDRWRTMPWMVTIFGILVIPLGLVHIFLVISQPLSVGAWCTFCLLAAGIMLPMIPLEIDEVIAMGQHMVKSKRNGESLWKVFWMGGTPDKTGSDNRSPEMITFPEKPGKVIQAVIWGMSFPWTLVVSAILGIWLMFAPAVFGIDIQARSADTNHLCGALIVVVAVICMGEVVRRGRLLNIPLGLAIAIIPWFLQDSNMMLNFSGTVSGLVVAALAVPRGPKKETYGWWDKYVH